MRQVMIQETPPIDVLANRAARKWSRSEYCGRVLWWLVTPLFRFSPRPIWAWRTMLLRLFGARVGLGVHVYPSVRIEIPWNLDLGDLSAVGDRVTLYALGRITVGARSTISQGSHLCAGSHDWRDPSMRLTKPTIEVGTDVWICADAFIGPGVVVGDRAIVGARAVAMSAVPAGAIVVGNPARVVRVGK